MYKKMLGKAEQGVQYAFQGSTILIIDDDPTTLTKVSDCLGQYGFRILVAPNGEAGLKQTRHACPDLILLDMLLPDIHGFEVCRRLKADPATRDIPVIFLTILTEVGPKVSEFGAVNYITKPFQYEEVRARVWAHLGIRNLAQDLPEQHEALRVANEALAIQVEERTSALAQANGLLQEQIHERQRVEERLRQYVKRVVNAQEAERAHIARELHDEIAQALALIKMNVRAVQRLARKSDLSPLLEQSLAMIEETLQRVRTLALDLRPSMLDDLGLVTTLRWYVERHAKWAGLDAEVVVESFETRIPQHLETVCFRVTQEALSNVARHAQARTVCIMLWQREGAVHMRIRDDGIGFDVLSAQEQAADGASIGLLGMEERVLLAGGQLVVESAPGRGTTLWLRLPLMNSGSAGEPAPQGGA